MRYVCVVNKAPDGTYSAYVPDLPDCTSSGDSLEELKRNLHEAVLLYLDSLREQRSPVPEPSASADVVEIVPDQGEEFGMAGAALAGQVLPAEDFSDWESPHGANGHGR